MTNENKTSTSKGREELDLMPLPAEFAIAGGELTIDGSFCVALTGLVEPRLARAARRLVKRLSAQTGIPLPAGIVSELGQATLTLHCDGATGDVQAVQEDESYVLTTAPKGAQIRAPGVYGILRGIETFLQLVGPGETGFAVPVVQINDRPRFPWRGLMLDVCRHWIPPDVVKRNLDAMAAVKLNVLHWHLTEDQGFRVESKRFPKLHEMGSDGLYYTQDEIREIVAFAYDRGIRVVPEIDLPGHAISWFVGHPELASAPGPYEIARTFGIKDAAMDPTREEVYAFLDEFFDEMVTLFPDVYVHIGGDEVTGVDWDQNPQIQTYIKENELEDNHGLQAYFNRRLQRILAGKGKSVVGWDEVLHPDLPQDIVVQSWRGQASLVKAVLQGYQSILSHGYYLDYGQPASFHYAFDPCPAPMEPFDVSASWYTWHIEATAPMGQVHGSLTVAGEKSALHGVIVLEDMNLSVALQDVQMGASRLTFHFLTGFGVISADLGLQEDRLEGTLQFTGFELPVKGNRSAGSDMPGTQIPELEVAPVLNREQKSRILGGEACTWAEMVNPETHDARIWPRMAAIAERLWSPAESTQDVDDMYRRLEATSAWLVWTGIQHRAAYDLMLQRMVNGDIRPLKTLAEVVEPIKFYSRHETREYSQLTPLNRLVDAVPAESRKARIFSQAVERLVDDSSRGADRAYVEQSLTVWRDNHTELLPLLQSSFLLQPVTQLSLNLSRVAEVGLAALEELDSGKPLQEAVCQQGLELLDSAAKPQDELLLQIVPAVRRLFKAACA